MSRTDKRGPSALSLADLIRPGDLNGTLLIDGEVALIDADDLRQRHQERVDQLGVLAGELRGLAVTMPEELNVLASLARKAWVGRIGFAVAYTNRDATDDTPIDHLYMAGMQRIGLPPNVIMKEIERCNQIIYEDSETPEAITAPFLRKRFEEYRDQMGFNPSKYVGAPIDAIDRVERFLNRLGQDYPSVSTVLKDAATSAREPARLLNKANEMLRDLARPGVESEPATPEQIARQFLALNKLPTLLVQTAEKLEKAQRDITEQLEAPVEQLANKVKDHLDFRIRVEEAAQSKNWKAIEEIVASTQETRQAVLAYATLHLESQSAQIRGDQIVADELCLAARLAMDRNGLSKGEIISHLGWLEAEDILPRGSEDYISGLIDDDVAFMQPPQVLPAAENPVRIEDLLSLGVNDGLAAVLFVHKFDVGRALLIVDSASDLGKNADKAPRLVEWNMNVLKQGSEAEVAAYFSSAKRLFSTKHAAEKFNRSSSFEEFKARCEGLYD